jgi:hypothetical protein
LPYSAKSADSAKSLQYQIVDADLAQRGFGAKRNSALSTPAA